MEDLHALYTHPSLVRAVNTPETASA